MFKKLSTKTEYFKTCIKSTSRHENYNGWVKKSLLRLMGNQILNSDLECTAKGMNQMKDKGRKD